MDPALLAELKTVSVCRETGETKLHRMTRMGHEVNQRESKPSARLYDCLNVLRPLCVCRVMCGYMRRHV